MRSKYRALIFALFFTFGLAIIVHLLTTMHYGITYSGTPSMPQGFYVLTPPNDIKRYDIVRFLPPKPAQIFLATRHWAPANNLLLKYVFGMPGDFVCITEDKIFINDKIIGPVYKDYAPDKHLPRVKFCGKLLQDQYLLLSNHIQRSFDGRYFGPVKKEFIFNKARRIL